MTAPGGTPSGGPGRRGRRVRALGWVAGAAAVALCALAVVRVLRPAGDDVLLISVDTLRIDRLGCYGGAASTPAIDGLAASGTLFERAYTNLPRTTPAFATILTGRYPQNHGVRFLHQPLDAATPVVAEALGRAGYRTAAFVAGGPLEPATGLNRGFGTYRCYVDLKAVLLALRTLPWMAWNLPRRTFLWAHFFDPHFGYQPPWPWDAGTPPAGFHLYEDIHARRVSFGELHFRPELSDAEHAWLRSLYTGEVHYTDAGIATLLRAVRLRDAITGGRTLVVLTADHGESLGEHGCWYEHGEFLYEPDVRIPLVVSWPGRLPAGRRSTAPAETIDVAPTLLDLLGVAPLPEANGLSLAPVLRGEAPGPRPAFMESGESFFPENERRRMPGLPGKWHAVRFGEWKVVRIPRPDGPPALELYDVRTDPAEGTNLASADPVRAARLTALLEEFLSSATHAGQAPPVLDEAAREKLRSLGYLD